MRALTQSELLDAWERASTGPAFQRPVILLVAACPEQTPQQLGELALAERDARLLSLRELSFGTSMICVTTCPFCAEQVEVSLETGEIRSEPAPTPEGGWELRQDGILVRFRPPNTLDLAEITHLPDLDTARRALLTRCLLSVEAESSPPVNELPITLQQDIATRMAEYQAQADVRVSLTCPSCASIWEAGLDIASYFWRELDAWARRVLVEIHRLALAYGWSEAEILRLSPRRRSFYLEMLQP